MKREEFQTIIKENGSQNLGMNLERLNYNNSELERAFSAEWKCENENSRGINKGHGILQDHFIEESPFISHQKVWLCKISYRERLIVATIIQWLGTNCGRSFLEKVLRKCGYKITVI